MAALTVLCQQIIGSSDDEFVDQIDQFLQLLFAFLFLRICSVGIPPAENRIFEIFAKIEPRAEDAWICKIQEGVVLGKIILHWRSSEQNATFDVDSVQSRVSGVLGIFKTMRFVSEKQTDLGISELVTKHPQRFVRHNDDRLLYFFALDDAPASYGGQKFCFSERAVNCERMYSIGAEPFDLFSQTEVKTFYMTGTARQSLKLTQFIRPIAYQRSGTSYYCFFDSAFARFW